jgi:diguanylate cyclase (GGDEF)-like protein
MDIYIRKMFRHVSALVNAMLILARRIDYKRLNQYIVGINRKIDIEHILQETARCVKDILHYRLFAFALDKGERLEVWIDPRIYQTSLEELIRNDFFGPKTLDFHYLFEAEADFPGMAPLSERDLTSYSVKGEEYFARLYLLPGRRMLNYHTEIMGTLLKTLGTAMTNFMNLKKLEHAASLDPLTNCYNKREFEKRMDIFISNARRYGEDLSVMMFDLDHFKNINDSYGHGAGDLVLRRISEEIHGKIRKGDFFCRFGGEEFIIVLPHTNKARAMELADRLRRTIEVLRVKTTAGYAVSVTASFGVAALRDYSDQQDLLEEVDAMLYMAKAKGRNRVMPQLKLLQSDACHLQAAPGHGTATIGTKGSCIIKPV